MEGRTKIFRDRVVSLDQTQELGERHLEILAGMVAEALPDFRLKEHGLEHEPDLYVLVVEDAFGASKRIAFTRMVLADALRVPAIAENRSAPVRGRIVELIRSRVGRPEILVGVRDLLTEDEQSEADALETEWRRKNEALLAARRAEEERQQRERRRRVQEEEARRRAERERQEKEKRDRAATAAGSVPGGGHPGRPGRGGRRRRRGGAPGPSQAAGAPAATSPHPAAVSPAPAPQGPGPAGGGRRRRRRGRRGGGGRQGPDGSSPSARSDRPPQQGRGESE